MSHSTPSTTPDPATPADSGDFRIQAPGEILTLLRRLQSERSHLILSNAAGLSVQSSLCSVDAASGRLLLDLPTAGSPLPALLGAEELTAVAYLDQIRLQFEVEGLLLVQPDAPTENSGQAVMQASLPLVLYRFQRRQAFRVRPNGRTPQARFSLPTGSGELLSLRVLDLSLGGLALQLPAGQDAPEAGTLLTGVLVELDRHTRLTADLRLQHARPQDDGSHQLGLLFEKLDPMATRDLQYYIEQVQKTARLLRKPAVA